MNGAITQYTPAISRTRASHTEHEKEKRNEPDARNLEREDLRLQLLWDWRTAAHNRIIPLDPGRLVAVWTEGTRH
jgi:hypothetical protein